MIKLSELSLLDIMPENLARDKEVQSAAKALDVSMHDISEQIKYVLLISRIDELEEDIVDQLAWQFHVDAYDSFRRMIFDPVMRHFHMQHTPHETRHTLASMLDSADINRTVIKLILGHSLEGVTERVYTHKTTRELLRAIDRICN